MYKFIILFLVFSTSSELNRISDQNKQKLIEMTHSIFKFAKEDYPVDSLFSHFEFVDEEKSKNIFLKHKEKYPTLINRIKELVETIEYDGELIEQKPCKQNLYGLRFVRNNSSPWIVIYSKVYMFTLSTENHDGILKVKSIKIGQWLIGQGDTYFDSLDDDCKK